MMFNKKSFILLLFSLVVFTLNAQGEINKNTNNTINPYLLAGFNQNINSFKSIDSKSIIKIESAGVFSDGDHAPFWLTSNNYGIASENKNNALIRVGGFSSFNLFKDKIKTSVGIDVIASHNLQTDFYFHQVYADFKYRSIGLSIGSKERINQFRNKYLSSGNMTLSNNARPIPQVEIGFPEFVNIPLTNEWVQVQGGLSYGWFLDDDYKRHKVKNGTYATDILYHRKYAYFKVENQTPWSFIVGLEMDTQWGGKMYKFKDGEATEYSRSPGNLKNFFKVLVPMSGGSDSNLTDQVNIVGNVYGSWHFVFNYDFKDYSIKGYYENFFEDHSGLIFKNMPDGIWGIEFNLKKKAPVSSVLFEYVHTKNQTGPFLWDKSPSIPVQVSAGDNYYNHGDYGSITNYGMVIGNPLLTSPIYNKDQSLVIYNNRIIALHGGLSGYINDYLMYRALVTYSRSWGTYGLPSKNIRNQFSSMLEVKYMNQKLKGWEFSGALAYDDAHSMMVGENFGFKMKISKTFHVK